MRKITSAFLFFVCLTITANVSFAQTAKRRAARPPVRVDEPIVPPPAPVDLGKLVGNTYTNDFFELKMEFPLGWLVGDHALESQLMKLSPGAVKTKNAQNQKAMDAAAARLVPLLGGYKSLPGTTAQNSNLRVTVESLKTLPQIKNGKDYLNTLVSNLKLVQLPPGFMVSEVKNETVDNAALDYLEIAYGLNRKRMYATVRKGYVLLLTIDSFDDADFEALHNVVLESDLNYKK
jgi:hypothetical protein